MPEDRQNAASAFRGEIGLMIRLYQTRGHLAFHQERLAMLPGRAPSRGVARTV